MTPREEYLTDSLTRFLKRRSMPQALQKQSSDVQRDEVQALRKAVFRRAPVQGYQDWWGEFVDALDERAETRAYPTVAEMDKAARAIRKESRTTIAQTGTWDSNRTTANRINAGEAIGEDWCYGRLAVQLMRETEITEADLKPYRSGAFMARRNMYGEEKALQWEAERKKAHAEAVKIYAKGDPERTIRLPQPSETRGGGQVGEVMRRTAGGAG